MSVSRRILLAIALCALPCAGAMADERILDFASEIRVQADASLLVTETITVRAEGNDIRRGIYRDFPTRYRDRLGNRHRVTFSVLKVQRDGDDEPYHLEQRSNGVRVYIGSASRTLAPGRYQYTLHYATQRQLGHFEGYDELYWNVTGTGWDFAIDRVTARVHLPGDVPRQALRSAVYTGAQGATAADAAIHIVDEATVRFESTAPLAPRAGMTIALGWPPGLVERPTAARKLTWFLHDNRAALVLLLGWLAAFAWYLSSWWRVGRDPRKGIIIPRFEPPTGLSPAACSYVLGMGFRRDAFVAALVSLGVKGCVRIDEQNGAFTLHRLSGEPSAALSRGETAMLQKLLPEAGASIVLEQEQHRTFSSALAALRDALAREHRGRLFRLNSWHAVPAVLATLVAAMLAIPLDAGPPTWIGYAVAAVVLHGVFLLLLRAPTPAGRKVMDEIEGFRMYLGTAERDRLDQMRSPRLTPEVFEAFLPYAFALGVQNRWCQRFADELPQEPHGEPRWQPGWYSGPASGPGAMGRLGTGFAGALSGAIAAAATPPGSASGSGGGGFSGGGGGGGGGGGW